MAPPPPSQAGKFKPRKPVKKPRASAVITPGAAASGEARPAAVASSDVARATGGGGGGARHQQGQQQKTPRRSYNYQPAPQGSVFFTGNNAVAAKKGSRSRSAGGRLKKDGGGAEGGEEEVVVGQLDVAIGSSAAMLAKQEKQRAKQAAAESAGDYFADDANPRPSRKSGSGNNQAGAALDYILYDSDSDNDVETWSENVLQPTQLPIPSNTTFDLMEPDQQQQFLPFDLSDNNAAEHSQWFLFQLPTRLPPLKTKDDDAVAPGTGGEINSEEATSAGESKMDETQVAAVTPEIPEVVTAPILAGSFDNALATAKSGKLGRIQIHKSGRAVLVMNGPEGKIRMNLTEGLSCRFFQQAVMINSDDGSYTPLGEVTKTIVATPDLDQS